MSLFMRTSSSAFQCTKRMVHDFISSNLSAKRPPKSSNKRVDSQFIANNDIILNNKLRNNEMIADDHWVEIRKELLKTYERGLSETTVDSLIYDLCEHHKRSDEAKNYFKFLERNNYNIPLSMLGRYLRLLSGSKEITEAVEEDICRICDHIREKHALLDARTCASCILALSLTKRWNEAFKLLDMLRFSDTPGQLIVGALCKAAFVNNKPELAWKLMNEFIEKFPMGHNVYLDYLEYCKRNFKGQNLVEEIEKIFYFWRENCTIPVDFVMEEYIKTFSTLGYKTSFTTIHKEQMCSKCHTTLKKSTLSESDFKILSVSVLKKLIIGKNVYQTTSPQELQRYMHFIKNLQPYDVIIDGLNVAYSSVIQKRGSLNNVLNVVNTLLKEYRRILVIGRVHMKFWSVETMKKIEQKADVFLVQNISNDDPFLLHLALVSGPQTYFVSRDLMRQHLHKLEDDHSKRLFQRWQLSRQYMVISDSKTHKEILIPPIPVETNAQKVDNGWHIPSTRNANLPLPQFYSIPDLWACLMKNESFKK